MSQGECCAQEGGGWSIARRLTDMLDAAWKELDLVRMTYLASPYTHPDPKIREERYTAACKAAAKMMQAGQVVFAPIAHSHPIEQFFGKVEGAEFWKRQDAPYLEACDRLCVLTLDGWDRSVGVAHEIRRAVERGIPIEYVAP